MTYNTIRSIPCQRLNFPVIIVGIVATSTRTNAAGKSIIADDDEIGSDLPEIIDARGIIRVKSKILAPRILPTDSDDCFLTIAVTVVTSSGREVPTATIVIPIILSLTCINLASALALSTSSCAPPTIPATPSTNLMIFVTITFPVGLILVSSSAFVVLSSFFVFNAERTFSKIKTTKAAKRTIDKYNNRYVK